MTTKKRESTALVWFRRDLRTHDNPALSAACSGHQSVIAVYFYTPLQSDRHDIGANHRWFTLAHVAALRDDLEQLGIPLLVREEPLFRDCPATLLDIAQRFDAEDVYLNSELEINEHQRDADAASHLEQAGVRLHTSHDQTIFIPGTITTQGGHFYKVFTPFKKAFITKAQGLEIDPLSKPRKISAPLDIDPRDLGEISNITPTCKKRWAIGETHARRALKAFVEHGIFEYKKQRDFPAVDATSRLSPYLAVGAISLRECLYEALKANSYSFEGGSEGIACWISELIWREFYKHLMIGFPWVCKHAAFNAEYSGVPWREAPADFQAWCEGRTGYPLVDAAMKQLVAEGWMHNRLRMVVAMFLTKHLLIDWRLGEKFFAQHLVDFDLAANNGGWQWSASTGADAAPYFRIFSPVRQSERFDPDGEFIKHYLPELAALGSKSIHSPSPLEAAAADYPQPITEHRFAVDRAKQTFRTAKEQQPNITEHAL